MPGLPETFLWRTMLPLGSVLGNPSGADGGEFIGGTLGENDHQHHDGADKRHTYSSSQHFIELRKIYRRDVLRDAFQRV